MSTPRAGRAPRSIMEDLGQVRCQAILRDKIEQNKHQIRTDEQTGCELWLGKLAAGGYWQIQYIPATSDVDLRSRDRPHHAYFVHRIAYVALHGKDLQQTGSHVCGNANCANPYHIVDETQADNNSRQRCRSYLICRHHGDVLYKFCQHDPVCIKPPEYTDQCCRRNRSKKRHKQPPPPAIDLPPVRTMADFLGSIPVVPREDFDPMEDEPEATHLIFSSSQGSAAGGDNEIRLPIRDAPSLSDTSQGSSYMPSSSADFFFPPPPPDSEMEGYG